MPRDGWMDGDDESLIRALLCRVESNWSGRVREHPSVSLHKVSR
jgi:hypothetical protein